MKITPIEIRQQDFNKVFRGYEKEEVDAFLKSLSVEWEKLIDENTDLRRRLEQAEREVTRLRDVESSLFKTIKNAEDTGANLIEHAQRQSDLHMREAQINAEAIMNEARNRARTMIEEAEMEAKSLVGNLQKEISVLNNEYKETERKKQHVLEEMKALGEGLLERVQREQNKPARAEASEYIEKVMQSAKDIKTEIKNDFSEFQMKTSITPIQTIIKPEAEEEVKPSFSKVKPATDTGNPSVDSAPAKETPKNDSKNNTGSFFDTI